MKKRKEKVIGRVTCVGRRLSVKGVKLIHVYIFEDRKKVAFATSLASGKRGKDIIGGVYEGEMIRDGESCELFGKWKYLHRIDESEQILTWTLEEKEHVGEYNAERREQKDKAIDAFQELLKPVQRAYYEASIIAKRALLAELIEFITRRPERKRLGRNGKGN
jgi:hypothetical protein